MAQDASARVSAARARARERLSGIYLIVNEAGARTLDVARAGLDAGMTVLQYRAKSGINAETLIALRAATRERGALLIVNDDWQAAATFDCDGVHLGPDDRGFADIAPVRAGLGDDRLIGLSCGTVAEAREAERLEADYIGVGSVYATASKSDAGAPIGLTGLRAILLSTTLPIAAIGGIHLENIEEVKAAGVSMAAVISVVAGAEQPADMARLLVAEWNRPEWEGEVR